MKTNANGRRENVTMKTIAEEAGVTLTTVSRVLNSADGKYKYAEKTRQRILEIADRLKYRPNALVRGMQTGRTGTAGVMVPTNGYYADLITGIHEEFVDNNTIMLLSWNNRSVNNREEKLERQIIHQMIDRRVEGIILRPSSEDFERSYFEEIWERNIPLILIDRMLAKIDTDFVGTDDITGGSTAAEHLIELGHRNLFFIGAGSSTSTSRLREDGFRRVLSESPNAYCRSLYENQGLVLGDETCARIESILKSDQRPTAIFCYNDNFAAVTAQIAVRAGLSIPRDISIIGFGNIPSFDLPVPLTTFNQNQTEIGRTAARMYLDRIRKPENSETRSEIIRPELIVRASTGPVPAR